MIKNDLYNLMTQAVTECQSLWRIEKEYVDQAETAADKKFWEMMKTDKEEHIDDLLGLIKEHIC